MSTPGQLVPGRGHLPAAERSVAERVFGGRLPVAEAYAEMLADVAIPRGLLGPREAPRLWSRHLLNCALVAPLVPERVTVADVGSGAGLPGLVVAIARPDLQVTLLEPLLRRVQFLDEVVTRLALTNVAVRRGRAEEVAGDLRVNVAVARAVAPLERLAEWALPLLEPGGELLALKGAAADRELVGAAPTLRRLGAVHWDVQVLGADLMHPPTRVVRVRAGAAGRRRARSSALEKRRS